MLGDWLGQGQHVWYVSRKDLCCGDKLVIRPPLVGGTKVLGNREPRVNIEHLWLLSPYTLGVGQGSAPDVNSMAGPRNQNFKGQKPLLLPIPPCSLLLLLLFLLLFASTRTSDSALWFLNCGRWILVTLFMCLFEGACVSRHS